MSAAECFITILPFDAQTKTSNAPLARSKSSAKPNAWGAASVPAAVMQAKPSQDSFSTVEVTSQASSDVSVSTRADDPVRMGSANTVTTEDHPVPAIPGTQSSTAPEAAPSKVQVRLSERISTRANDTVIYLDMQQCIVHAVSLVTYLSSLAWQLGVC